MKYRIVPLRMSVANEFIQKYHRHNKPVDHRAHRFSIGLMDGDKLIGVAIAGQPIAQKNDDGFTLEILRVCVLEGYPNANSMLYARVKRIGLLMGYKRIITYTLQSESGASLRAIGAKGKPIRVSSWSRPARKRSEQPVTMLPKIRWELLENGGE
ncbi:MAG: XF1762 family protein [Thermoplasmata archaeon]